VTDSPTLICYRCWSRTDVVINDLCEHCWRRDNMHIVPVPKPQAWWMHLPPFRWWKL
jgi:NMD protein affecting ribosome stability and mRNA decay